MALLSWPARGNLSEPHDGAPVISEIDGIRKNRCFPGSGVPSSRTMPRFRHGVAMSVIVFVDVAAHRFILI